MAYQDPVFPQGEQTVLVRIQVDTEREVHDRLIMRSVPPQISPAGCFVVFENCGSELFVLSGGKEEFIISFRAIETRIYITLKHIFVGTVCIFKLNLCLTKALTCFDVTDVNARPSKITLSPPFTLNRLGSRPVLSH